MVRGIWVLDDAMPLATFTADARAVVAKLFPLPTARNHEHLLAAGLVWAWRVLSRRTRTGTARSSITVRDGASGARNQHHGCGRQADPWASRPRSEGHQIAWSGISATHLRSIQPMRLRLQVAEAVAAADAVVRPPQCRWVFPGQVDVPGFGRGGAPAGPYVMPGTYTISVMIRESRNGSSARCQSKPIRFPSSTPSIVLPRQNQSS